MIEFLRKLQLSKRRLLLYLSLTFLIELLFSYALKGSVDLESWKEWMVDLGRYQLSGTYVHDDTINYPPVFIAFLWIYQSFVKNYDTFTLKLPVVLFNLLMLAVLMVSFKRMKLTGRNARLLILYFICSPLLLFVGSIWGQIDFVHSALMCLAILTLPVSPLAAGIAFGLALLTKFQSIVIAPVLALYLFKQAKGLHFLRLRQTWIFVIGAALPWLIASSYFVTTDSFWPFLHKSYFSAVGFYPNLSLEAMNIWYHIFGVNPMQPDTDFILPFLTYRAFGFILLGLFTAYTLFYLFSFRTPGTIHLFKAGFLLSFSFYMLPTEIHDRYIIPAVLMCAFIAFFEKKRSWFAILLGMELCSLVSLVIALKHIKYHWMEPLGTYVAAAFLLLFAVVVWMSWIETSANRRARRSVNTEAGHA